jgi:hypothetical protein
LALRASDICHGDAAALFSFFALRSKASLFRLRYGSANTPATFLNDNYRLCEILASIEGVGVRQKVDLLLGSAATSYL